MNKYISIAFLIMFMGGGSALAQTDYDMFLGETSSIHFFERQNSGAGSMSFSQVTGNSNPFNGLIPDIQRPAPAFVDIDGDGDYDCFIGEYGGTILYYRNTGSSTSATFVAQTGSNNPLSSDNGFTDVGWSAAPAFVDIDGDGDYDCFIGDYDGKTEYYKNNGNSSVPDFDHVTGSNNPFDHLDFDPGGSNSPAFVDIDGDGDYDCFMGEYSGNINYYKNNGNSSVPDFDVVTGNNNPLNHSDFDVGIYSAPAFVDLDGDGDYDCIASDRYAITEYFKNTGNSSSATFVKQTGGNNPFDGFGDHYNWDYGHPQFVNIDGDAVLNTVSIDGDDGFRMMSSPVSGTIYSDLLAELWTQGMTGADDTNGDANVWTYSVAGQSWSALTNLSTASLTAGAGFLVYVYADTDNDGDDDLAVTLSVNGTANNSSATVGSIADGEWALIGNPYVATIGWDNVTKTYLATSAYVYDDANSRYNAWNGSAGSLSNGLIAAYQGFWVQASGGTGSITIDVGDKSTTAGTFYKTMNDSTGSMSFSISSGDYSDQTYVSFINNGQEGIDNSDAYKLLPMSPSERVVGISYAEGNGLDINNLPYVSGSSIDIPFDVMCLTLDEDYNFVTQAEDVNMTWDLSSLPETIIGLTLTNNTTGETTDLLQTDELTFITAAKGSFPAYGSNGVNIYPEVGESQFTLTVAYSALSAADEATNVPKEFALHPAYPNPFNPSTTIRFDLPEEGFVSMSVYDITGKLVETLVNEILPTGNHSMQWNPVNLSSGLYIVQLKAGEIVFNQKITFIK